MVNLGIAFIISGPAIMLALIIIGARKALPYRNVNRDKFNAIYKPYKFWGLCIWGILTLIGLLLISNTHG